MSAINVKGNIVGKVTKTFNGKKGPFEVTTYFVVNGNGGRPTELKSYDSSRNQGDKIDVPVYMRFWRTDKGSGCNLYEIQERK